MNRKKREDFQVAVQLLRDLNGWSQTEIAQAAGLRTHQVSLIESGQRRPTPKTLSLLLAAAGVSPPAFQQILEFLRRLRAGDFDLPATEGVTEEAREVELALLLGEDEILERRGSAALPSLEPKDIAEELRAESLRLAQEDPERAAELLKAAERMDAGLEDDGVN